MASKLFTSGVKIVNKNDENNRDVEGYKRHIIVFIFGAGWNRKIYIGLKRFCDTNLVKAGDVIHEPTEFSAK